MGKSPTAIQHKINQTFLVEIVINLFQVISPRLVSDIIVALFYTDMRLCKGSVNWYKIKIVRII